jgi:hypothetical protein
MLPEMDDLFAAPSANKVTILPSKSRFTQKQKCMEKYRAMELLGVG